MGVRREREEGGGECVFDECDKGEGGEECVFDECEKREGGMWEEGEGEGGIFPKERKATGEGGGKVECVCVNIGEKYF